MSHDLQDGVLVTSPTGPRFPIRDLQVDLLDRLQPCVEDEELLSLKLDENEISILNAENLCHRFPNLEKVSICYNNIKRIDMFPWFTNLRELYLKGNLLTIDSINAKSWKACSRTLEILDLSNNKYNITIVSHLKVLKALRTLSLKGNPCELYNHSITLNDHQYSDDERDEDRFGSDDDTEGCEDTSDMHLQNYRDIVTNAISGLLVLDGFKTCRALKPQHFLRYNDYNDENVKRNGSLPNPTRFDTYNKQELKQELPHRDIVNQAFANVRSEATTLEREHFERQIIKIQDDFSKTLQRQKESFELEYKQRIKKDVMEACEKLQDELNVEFHKKQTLEINNLNARHKLEIDTLLQKHEIESKKSIREAVDLHVKQTRLEMKQNHSLDKSRMKKTMVSEFNEKIRRLQETNKIEMKEGIDIAVSTAIEEKEIFLKRLHNIQMKKVVNELSSNFQAKEQLIASEERIKRDQEVAKAVNSAIEKVVFEKEALKLKIEVLKTSIKAYEEQLESQESTLGRGKASEVVVATADNDDNNIRKIGDHKDDKSNYNDNKEETKKLKNKTTKQIAAGYTRLLMSWRQKVFELLIQNNVRRGTTNNLQVAHEKRRDASSFEQQEKIAVLQAKLEYAQNELSKLKQREGNQIRMEEKIKHLSEALEDTKIILKEKEKDAEAMRMEMINFKSINNRFKLLQDVSSKNKIEQENIMQKYNHLLSKAKSMEQLILNKDDEINKLNDDVSNLNALVKEYTQKIEIVSTDLAKLQTLVENKKHKIASLKEEISKLNKLRKEDLNTQADICEIQKIVASKESKILTLKEELAKSTLLRSGKTQELAKLNEKYEANKMYTGKLTNELEELKKIIDAATKLEEENMSTISNLQDECMSSKREVENIKDLILESRRECAYLVAHVLEPIIETFAGKCRVYESTQDVITNVYKDLTEEQIIQLKKIDCDH
eukprot:g6756.t1